MRKAWNFLSYTAEPQTQNAQLWPRRWLANFPLRFFCTHPHWRDRGDGVVVLVLSPDLVVPDSLRPRGGALGRAGEVVVAVWLSHQQRHWMTRDILYIIVMSLVWLRRDENFRSMQNHFLEVFFKHYQHDKLPFGQLSFPFGICFNPFNMPCFMCESLILNVLSFESSRTLLNTNWHLQHVVQHMVKWF